jgi:MerR family transcriptional regulator, light-induced transcriptional regulator
LKQCSVSVVSLQMPSKYSIKDLERLSGIKAHTLRIWEQRYNILKPLRTDTNIRLYSNQDLRRILNISMLNNNGKKISKIAQMEDDMIALEVEKIVNTYKNENDQVDGLVLSMVEYNEDKFESIISNCILHFGFEKTYENVLIPFLRHTGIMWRIGMINPAQEHFISNLIRRKLLVAIDGIDFRLNSNPKHFVFFLPDRELHELSLLYYYYLAKVNGHKCLYLGQTVPMEDLIKVNEVTGASHYVCVITTQLDQISIDKYLQLLSQSIPEKGFWLSGAQVVLNEVKMPEHFYKFGDSNEFKSLF